MKIAAYIFLIFFIASFFAAQDSYATTTVHITSNGSGADSNVNIQNSVNSSSYSSSSSNSHTTVHMETNGKVQDYNSDNAGEVHMQSDDGNAKVDITNNAQNPVTITQPTIPDEPSITISPTIPVPNIDQQKILQQLEKTKAKIEEKKKQVQIQHENILQRIEGLIKRLFSPNFFSS